MMSYYPCADEPEGFCPQRAHERHKAAAACRAMRIPNCMAQRLRFRPVTAARLSTTPGGYRCGTESETGSETRPGGRW